MNELIEKVKFALGTVEHPEWEDTWHEVRVDGEYYDCNIFSRKLILDEEDDLPDVVADIYATHMIEVADDNGRGKMYRETDTDTYIGRFYPQLEEDLDANDIIKEDPIAAKMWGHNAD